MESDLVSMSEYPFPIKVSAGFEDVARRASLLCMSAKERLDNLFQFSPTITLYVLSEKDWENYSFGPVYGMPHYSARRIIMAAEKAGFWKKMIQLIQEDEPQNTEILRTVYADASGDIDLSAFFSVLTIHELGHAYHAQLPFQFPRLWLQETFANLCNHVCIALDHPELLEILTMFPDVISQVDPKEFEYRTWNEFEENYELMSPINYGWYQGRLKGVAVKIYNHLGEESVARLWNTFALRDKELFEIIDSGVCEELSKHLLES